MKKVILIGAVGSGKTTLSQKLICSDVEYKKTQQVEVVGGYILDTPGEYIERKVMQNALMITSMDADVVILIQSATDLRAVYYPAYAGSFEKDVIGVVTKIDLASEREIAMAHAQLELAGASRIFDLSNVTGEGLEELNNYLSQ